ncbi:casein kinase 1, delta [Schizothecium vesticola]|uniref:non-specific serine/threonine protein kinase n=1 Tax=Schizothecium vesticola TaxID=314040 RepID=A0AA40F5X8_9PEZI|nr:casein kinase 1, delta [Schizothecium vesticola]
MKDILIADRFPLERRIGKGGFGVVYSGTDIERGHEVAIKLADGAESPYYLRNEKYAYAALAGGVGVPRVWWLGDECDFYILVMDLLGPSLEDLFNYCDRSFSLKTVLLIADQLLSRFQHIHSKDLLHRDIKPENFLMGTGTQGNIIYVIDFGLAMERCDNRREGAYEGLPFGGTSLFASIKNHNGREQSFADDLESIGYMLCYFACGLLPWEHVKAPTDEERNELLKQKKLGLSGRDICGDGLPEEFATYIDHTRSLGSEVKPDYSYLRQLFRRRFRSEGFKYDNVYDWTENRFHEITTETSQSTSEQRPQGSTGLATTRRP